MAVKKLASLKKQVGSDLVTFLPRTNAEAVLYDTNLSVKDVLDVMIESVETIENVLYADSVYMTDSAGEIITDDGGTGLVAIPSIKAVSIVSE